MDKSLQNNRFWLDGPNPRRLDRRENSNAMTTVNLLQGVLEDSDDWGAAEIIATQQYQKFGTVKYPSLTGSLTGPVDHDNTSLELELSYALREGHEPSFEETKEYLEKHQLQAFMTEVLKHVANHLPPDPFQFLLDHIEAMVMKYRATRTIFDGEFTSPPPIPEVTPKQAEKIVRHIANVLHQPVIKSQANRFIRQFASKGEVMTEENFGEFLKSLQVNWGLQPTDTRFMQEVLKRWRFRSNAANGTRGLPLWPLSRADFVTAFPFFMRALRDRYVPIGAIHRSVFIRQMEGDLESRYDMGARLGRGAYGEVQLVILKETQEKRVCKRIMEHQSKVPDEEVASEVDLLRSLDHPHIIRVFEYFEKDGFLNIVMEPVFGGTLTHIVDALYFNAEGEPLGTRPDLLTEPWVATAISQILSALVYAHEVAGVIHKDLKTDNIMRVGRPKLSIEEQLQENVHMMLADFGIAEVFTPALAIDRVESGGSSPRNTWNTSGHSGRSSRVGGTPSYMSPEMFMGSFSEKCDIWSLGVIFFRLMTGEYPYKADNILMQANVVANPRRHPKWEILSLYRWSLGARRLCQQLLTKDESIRPSASEAFKSDWIQQAKSSQEVAPMATSERDALQELQMRSHMTQMAIHAITSQLNLTQLHKLNLQFKKYDSTGDGRLSLDEMRQVLEDSGIESMETKDLIVLSLDSDHSGKIEYSEFIAGCLDIGAESIRSQIPLAFSVFDLDNSGNISMEELRLILTQGANDKPAASLSWSGTSGLTLSDVLPDGTTVDKIMKDLDADKNGRVDCFEFERYLLKEHEKMARDLEFVKMEAF